jgi:hypothetical protein
MAGAPKIEDLYTKIWTELSPAQQKAVDGKLQEFRDQQAKEREEKYVQQRLSKKKGEAPKPGEKPNARPGAAAPDRASAPIDPERRDRLLRLFSRLSPEQQEQLLTRLERARAENGGNSPPAPGPQRRRGGNDGRGEPKPAPEPDDSMMPPPPKPAAP